jgi:hypothetical protein
MTHTKVLQSFISHQIRNLFLEFCTQTFDIQQKVHHHEIAFFQIWTEYSNILSRNLGSNEL